MGVMYITVMLPMSLNCTWRMQLHMACFMLYTFYHNKKIEICIKEGGKLWWSPHWVNVLNVGAESKIKNRVEFPFSISFNLVSRALLSPVPTSTRICEKWLICCFTEWFLSRLCLSPLPHKDGLSSYRTRQMLQITTKSSCEALRRRICTDQNLKCLLA